MTTWTLLELKNGSGSVYNTVGLSYNTAGVFYDYLHLPAQWSKPNKSTTAFTNATKSAPLIQARIGSPVGLLLSITYATDLYGATPWTLTSKH